MFNSQGGLSKRKLRKLKKQKQHQPEGDNPAAAAAADGADGGGEDTAAVAARDVLLEKLRGSWGVLVQTPSGSFLLEAVYNNTVSSVRRKQGARVTVLCFGALFLVARVQAGGGEGDCWMLGSADELYGRRVLVCVCLADELCARGWGGVPRMVVVVVLVCTDELCGRGGRVCVPGPPYVLGEPRNPSVSCCPALLAPCPALSPLQTPEQAEALVAEVAAVSDQLMSRCSWGALVARKLGLEAYERRLVDVGVGWAVACGLCVWVSQEWRHSNTGELVWQLVGGWLGLWPLGVSQE